MDSVTLLRDDEMPAARSFLRRLKVRVDPAFRGELRALQRVVAWRKSYFAQRGLTLDAVGESLWSAGYVAERPASAQEVLDLLRFIFERKTEKRESLPEKIRAYLADGKPRTRHEIRRALHLSPEVALGRAVRRLRRAPFHLAVVTLRVRGKLHYQLQAENGERIQGEG